MQLTIKNKDLKPLYSILDKITVTNMKANRGRAKLLVHVANKFDEYAQDELDIYNACFVKDDEGKFVAGENNLPEIVEGKTRKEVNDLIAELANEDIILKGGENSKRYMDFLEYLEESEDSFTAEEVIVIDSILEQYEASKIEKGEAE